MLLNTSFIQSHPLSFNSFICSRVCIFCLVIAFSQRWSFSAKRWWPSLTENVMQRYDIKRKVKGHQSHSLTTPWKLHQPVSLPRLPQVCVCCVCVLFCWGQQVALCSLNVTSRLVNFPFLSGIYFWVVAWCDLIGHNMLTREDANKSCFEFIHLEQL